MIIFAALAAVVLVVALGGGDLTELLRLRVKAKGTIIVAIVAQVFIVTIDPTALPRHADDLVHLGTYACAIWFLFANRHIGAMGVAALGGGLNLAAIAANGGTMPAAPAALRSAGLAGAHAGFANSATVAHARLAFLGDIFSVPKGWPFANVFSVGDLVLLAGASALLVTVCGCPRLGAPRRADGDTDGATGDQGAPLAVSSPS